MKQRLAELEDLMSAPDFWQDSQKAAILAREADELKTDIDFWQNLDKRFADLDEMLVLVEQDASFSEELSASIAHLTKEIAELRIHTLFTGKYDSSPAIFAIHAGAGGTDAQDWTEILLRMYLRYFERRKWKVEILSRSEGSEAGIKSVVLQVDGPHAYGYLQVEAGVHRLVRLSPFNPAHTRETSFALVEVLPFIPQAELTIDPKDLKVEASTASGHGGQSVNTTYSAIRLTHIPTGITVSIQNERSQHQNKEKAMQVMHSRLAKLEEEKRQQQRQEIRGEFSSPEWGSQIRSYVLHPYKLVKDHRTEYETSDVDAILDGEIEDFIEKALEQKAK